MTGLSRWNIFIISGMSLNLTNGLNMTGKTAINIHMRSTEKNLRRCCRNYLKKLVEELVKQIV